MTTKKSFIYKGKGETFIASSVRKKARKGHYKNDLIELTIVSKSENFVKTMTQFEALIIINALSFALFDSDNIKKGRLLR